MNRGGHPAYTFKRTHGMDDRMVHRSRRIGSAGVRLAEWEADLARDDAFEDQRRFARGMAWASAISAPFWLAVLAALLWL